MSRMLAPGGGRSPRDVVAYVIAAVVLTACAPLASRFPTEVQTAVAHDDMRRLETERFIIYYPAARRAQIDRFLARADGCARTLQEHALIKASAKIVIVMPDTPFNNAFVAPDALGYEQVSVIPTYSTLDFATAFGLPPDPGAIACHELVHYIHFQQTTGFWGTFNKWFGPMYTPQLGYDPWFDEGIATHYEARLTPGLGRPVWPLFTGMFAAAYAGTHISSGELSAFGRNAPVGHHYLVGSMFVRFLAERYGERPLWTTIENQSHAFTGWFFTGTFSHGFSVSFGDLLDQFARWVDDTFPARARPPTQSALGVIGNDARYARGRDGTEAWVAEDVDSPPRLTVRDARGKTLLDTSLVEILPPRTLAIADPLLTSGLSITADGNEVWLTAIDYSATFQVTRLLRWRRGERGLREVARNLGPGATIDPTGTTYYYCEVDGDRWSLAAYDVRSRARRKLVDMKPGTYVLGGQLSADGKQLAASVWNGTAFVIWIVDTQTGAQLRTIIGNHETPVYDPSFTADGRVMYLGVTDGRFQAFIDNTRITDAPYAVLAARAANGTIRFLDREKWNWELAEVTLPAAPPPPAPAPTPPPAAPAAPTDQPPSDQPAPGQTGAGQSAAGQPAAGQSAAGQPTAGQPTAGQPTAGQRTAGQSAAGQPRARQTAAGQSAAGQQPTAGQPTAGQPPAGQPAAGQPAARQPAAGQSAAGQPAAGQTTAAQPTARQPAAGQSAAGQPAAGQSAAGQPAAGQPAAGQPAAGQPAAGRPAAGQPAAGQSAAGQPAPGQPTAGPPAAGQPAAGQSAAGQPSATAQPQPTWITAPAGLPPTGSPPPQQSDFLGYKPPPTLYPPTPIPLPAPGSVPVQSDESYSAFDHLFYPAVRSPTLAIGGAPPHIGLVLGGADRLELQRWMLAGYVQPRGGGRPVHYGGSAGYLNNMLAPVFVLGQASFLDWSTTTTEEQPGGDPIEFEEEHRTRDAIAAIGYTYRGTLTGTIGGIYTDDYEQIDTDPSLRRYVAGPSATLSWYSAENTRYTGPRRALLVAGQAAFYPEQWSTFMGNITDVGGTVGFTLPLPFGRRHTFSAFARARSLITPGETGLLQVGGDSTLGFLWNRSNKMEPTAFDDSRFPPNLRFVEPLRGFEDFAIASDRVKLGEVSWKYPIIIDRGTAAVWFLPAAYLRQLELEPFATGAIVDANDRHYAVGAAITLRMQFIRIPLAITYQIARRLSDDEALTQFVGIGPDI